MTDEQRVIAEAGLIAILEDGSTRHTDGRSGWISAETACDLLADAVRRLTERIEAVEKAIQHNSVDLGELALVTEQDARDVRGRFSRLLDRVASLERKVPESPYEREARWSKAKRSPTDRLADPDDAESKFRDEIRREMAREIAERLRKGDPSGNFERDGIVASWIAREYLDKEDNR